jgi:hypothetical protein
MTVLALITIDSGMGIILEMTGNTLGGGIFVYSGAVASNTADLGMTAQQWELGGLGMIEKAFSPALGTVALGAVLAQSPFMRILFQVTGHAYALGFTARLVLLMTFITGCSQVRTFQREVGELVSERGIGYRGNNAIPA